jgi:predicted TPR repeat methyltransferase
MTYTKEYWEDRYNSGGNSGAGSRGDLALFKASIVNSVVSEFCCHSIGDFGCGDGYQASLFNLDGISFNGYDISNTAVEIASRVVPNAEFKNVSEYGGDRYDLSISMDVLFHLIEDGLFASHLDVLFASSMNLVLIYGYDSDEDPSRGAFKAQPHMKYRKFTGYISKRYNDFELIRVIKNKYPYNLDKKTSSVCDFYLYKKKDGV